MRFGVIGVGNIGPTNVKALMAVQGAQIVAVANRTRANSERLCRTLGLDCPVYEDWKEMLSIYRFVTKEESHE